MIFLLKLALLLIISSTRCLGLLCHWPGLICMQASWCFLLSAGSKNVVAIVSPPIYFSNLSSGQNITCPFYCRFYKSPIGRLIKDRFPQTHQLFLCSCSGADQTRVPCSMLPRENGACAQSTKVNWIYVRLLTWADCPQVLAKMPRLKNGPIEGVF